MQRWIVTGLFMAGLVLSGALGGALMRHGNGTRRLPGAAARQCDPPLKVASAASPIVASHPEGPCDAAAKGGD